MGSLSHDLQGLIHPNGGCLGFLNHQQYHMLSSALLLNGIKMDLVRPRRQITGPLKGALRKNAPLIGSAVHGVSPPFFLAPTKPRKHRQPLLGGGFKDFIFSPLFGEDEPILTNIFQMG